MPEERRLVSVLFADVVGSTALGESLDPEDVRALLARLFAIAADAVDRHGGRIEKFIGDAIMAVFGIPTAHDDDAARALSAALDLRDRVQADAVLGTQLPIRLGVNTGEVIATLDADASQFLLTGDAVNVAARLQQAAEPWSIVVGDRACRAAGGAFRFGEAIAIEAKGKAQPVAARVLEGRAEQPPRRSIGRMVGRQADLDQLQLVAKRAFGEGRPYLVSVIAAAGVGKSRLLEELLRGLTPDAHVATAQCLPYGQRLTYWPMRSILLSIVGLPEEASPQDVLRGTERWLRDAGEPDPERTAELLAATIGASETEGDRLAVFAAWRRLVELGADRQPLVVVIEDLHWSSDSLLDLVESMLQPRAEVPLLMLVLARPELLDRRPTWGGGRRNAIAISLEPLEADAVADLVGDLLEDPDPAIVEAVVERADGNPFYAGEIVRSLVDRLGPTPDRAAVDGAIAALPDTVHATVLARLDALEPRPRRVVQLGAVLGRTFQPRAVPALDAAMDAEAVDAAIEILVERELLRPSGRSAVTFRHILIREVAYGTLPRAERARLHGAAGRWLDAEARETGRVDELAELVAFHLREAVALGSLFGEPAPRDLLALAVEWLRRAGDVAGAGAAAAEAARHLNAAIELAPREVQPDIYERLAQIWAGGEQAVDAVERAYELGRELDLGPDQELRTLAQVMEIRARWTGSIGHRLSPDDERRRYSEIERLLGEPVSDLARAHGLLALAFRPMLSTQVASSAELAASARWAALAVDLIRRLDSPDLLSSALDAASIAPLFDDRMGDVIEILRERHAIEDRVSTGERTDAWIVHAWAEVIRGNLEASERAAERAMAGLVSGQASAWVLGASCWRVFALYVLGRWDEALVAMDRGERAWQESELAAPGYALNGLYAAYAICRGRGDSVGASHWRELSTRIQDRTDPDVRNQRLRGFVEDDGERIASVLPAFRVFTPRLDYVYLALDRLSYLRQPVDADTLDGIVEYAQARDLRLIVAAARRHRGIERRDVAEMEAAIAVFDSMGAGSPLARARSELGLLRNDAALVEAAVTQLVALGDVEHAEKVRSEQREGRLVAR